MTSRSMNPEDDFGVRTYECYNCGVAVVLREEQGIPRGWLPSLFNENFWRCDRCAPRVGKK